MPRGPLEPKLPKAERKALAARLRALIAGVPRNMRDMASSLEVDPELVVVALRELRARKRGALRSTIQLGHVAWWWEDGTTEKAAKGKKQRKKAKKHG